MKIRTAMFGWIMALALCNVCTLSASDSADEHGASNENILKERWVCSENFEIAINQHDKPKVTVTSGHMDFKPSWSKTGDKLTFFRRIGNGRGFHTWRTKICVVNIDGSGFKELTNGEHPDFNPTWTRDGSNMVIFNRYSTVPEYRGQIFMISPDGSVGDKQLVSHPGNSYLEWAMSTLKDGRIFMDRLGNGFIKSFLLTPKAGELGKYEELKRPTEKHWHKLSISPDETRVAYMLDNDGRVSTYGDAVIAIADFDVEHLILDNQIIITEMDPDSIHEYPRWSGDGNYVLYDSNRSGVYQMYAYHLPSRKTSRISPDINGDYRFGNCEKLPK